MIAGKTFSFCVLLLYFMIACNQYCELLSGILSFERRQFYVLFQN